jgi:hypothetical protein
MPNGQLVLTNVQIYASIRALLVGNKKNNYRIDIYKTQIVIQSLAFEKPHQKAHLGTHHPETLTFTSH